MNNFYVPSFVLETIILGKNVSYDGTAVYLPALDHFE